MRYYELLEPLTTNSSLETWLNVLRREWVEHSNGKQNWRYRLWSVLIFQAWLEFN